MRSARRRRPAPARPAPRTMGNPDRDNATLPPASRSRFWAGDHPVTVELGPRVLRKQPFHRSPRDAPALRQMGRLLELLHIPPGIQPGTAPAASWPPFARRRDPMGFPPAQFLWRETGQARNDVRSQQRRCKVTHAVPPGRSAKNARLSIPTNLRKWKVSRWQAKRAGGDMCEIVRNASIPEILSV